MVFRKKGEGRRQQAYGDSFGMYLLKSILGVLILLVVVVSGGAIAVIVLDINPPARRSVPQPPPEIPGGPVFEVYPHTDTPPSEAVVHPVKPGAKPRVAIIIDDFGYNKRILDKFLSLGAPVAISILPFSPFTKAIDNRAHERGALVMLHLPMEPEEYPAVNPGPGVLLATMSSDVLLRQMEDDLAAVPHAVGVNNHMGSRLTVESTQLYKVFFVLKKNNCFFVDSRTSPKSLCRSSARLFQVPFAERDIFLDNKLSEDYIAGQLDKLVSVAKKRGHAIGIGHAHTITCEVLKKKLPAMKKEVSIVPVSELVHIVS